MSGIFSSASRCPAGATSRPRRALYRGLPVLLALLSGCASSIGGIDALPDREFTGRLIAEERANWFRPCGVGPREPALWVTFTNAAVGQIADARARGIGVVGDTAFVHWRAALTDERHVGPGGPALLVRDILEVRDWAAGDCGAGTQDRTR